MMMETIDISDLIPEISKYDVLEKLETEDLIEELNERILTYDEQESLRDILEEYGFEITKL